MSIELKDLSFSYGKKSLLEGLSFTVKEGEFIGILGPNGSGKSTLVKNMLSILPFKVGQISFFGKDLKAYDLKELSRLIGFVPQKSALSLPLLVKDVLLMGRYAGLKNAFSSYTKEDIRELELISKELYIEEFLERSVLSLSGGEFQRVLLARALLKKPKILLLDEPTSALDMNYAIELLSLCESLLKKQKLTVVAILHDLNLASMFCERILFLKEGKLLYEGCVNELFTKEILKEIYDLNCEIIKKDERIFIIPIKEKK
ncbi:ABC transporter ATP-binding protein [Campylobacter troglodytis]|uniref:ABC transporter ATP-binding protein n=1 Tax=Campylobacter troglodytis TaxID=654363 RepID=UPI0011583D03|nr:ABC transporter ATP-binding protein [Campylobacter troglodytis]TQR55798.1 ABC transporter ATP-binding protein [Campylobacter troglodytis]